MKQIRGIRSIFFRYALIMFLIFLIAMGFILVVHEISQTRSEISRMQSDFVQHQQDLLKREIKGVFQYIQYRRSRSTQRILNRTRSVMDILCRELNGRVDKQIASSAEPLLSSLLPPEHVQFGVLSPAGPIGPARDLETNILDHIRDKTVTGAEFQYRDAGTGRLVLGSRPEAGNAIVFAVFFEGNRDKALQQDVLDYIASIRFGSEGYVFVNTFEGIPLIRDGERIAGGDSMWELTDPNGVKVIQEEYRAATKPGGDFIYYSWRRLNTTDIGSKMSFIRGHEAWRWMIGAGIYLDDIKPLLNEIREAGITRLEQQMLRLALAFLVVLTMITYFGNRMARRLGNEFSTMSRFFQQHPGTLNPINRELLRVTEFRELADDINKMVTERRSLENNLQESESQFRQLFEQSTDAMSILSRHVFLDHNESLVRMFGASSKEELLVSPIDLSPEFQPDGRPSTDKAREIIRETFKNGRCHFEWMHRRLDGGLFWCEIVLTRIPWHGDQCLFVVWRDISARKNAESELRQSESRLRKSQEMAHVGNWVLDLDSNAFSGSDELYNIYGYGNARVPISPDKALVSILDEDRESTQKALRELIIHDRPYDVFFRIRRESDGSIRHINSRAEAIRNEAGRCLQIVGTVQDITTLKELEMQALQERERLEVILQSIADGVLVTDANQRVILMNPVCSAMTGVPTPETGSPCLQDVLQFDQSEAKEPGSSPIPEEGVLVSRDGTKRQVLISRAPVSLGKGEATGHVLVIRDVTRFRQMEQEIQKTQRLESLGVLAGGIAHDFNNQLMGITGNLSLARSQMDPVSPTAHLVEEAERAADACRGLTGQLLTFSTGGEPMLENLDLVALVQETARFVLRGKPVQLILNVPETAAWIEADPVQIRQVVSNILINASQVMPSAGQITVTVTPSPGNPQDSAEPVQLVICDNGPGIPEEIRNRIFDPFFTTRETGTGLGLSIVHSVVQRHHGTITVDSEPGKGTCFTISLPARPAPVNTGPPAPKSAAVRTMHILVMDDEAYIREVTSEMLSFLGHRVSVTASGEDAVQAYVTKAASGDPFDLVILDVTVPGAMGGQETIIELRRMDPHVRAIVTSGYSSDPLLADFAEHGFAGRLEKPFSLERLKQTIDDILNRN